MMSSDGFMSLQDRVFLYSTELKQPEMSSISGNSSEPKVPPDSPGSSVSSRLQVVHLDIIQEKYDYVLTDSVLMGLSSACGIVVKGQR